MFEKEDKERSHKHDRPKSRKDMGKLANTEKKYMEMCTVDIFFGIEHKDEELGDGGAVRMEFRSRRGKVC